MPVPKFTISVLDQAIAVRRGTKKLEDVSKKDLAAVKDALGRNTVLMTHLRLQNPSTEAVTSKPHVRGV